MSMKRDFFSRYLGIGLLAIAALIIVFVTPAFTSMWEPDLLLPGPGVTKQTLLSEYFPKLRGTPFDTDVYVLEGSVPGGTTLVLSGVHCNEPGAYLTGALLVESAKVTKGRLIVIPFATLSGFTHSDPGEGAPQRFTIDTPNGPRIFKYGSRAINPIYSWPDPEVFVHYPSGQKLAGEETRNTNRAFPGKENGTPAERICFGITELIKKENVDLVIDLHEAMPEYPNINVIVAHQRALTLAASAQVRTMIDGMQIALSPSPVNFHGLSHRELGDYTNAFVVLMEAPHLAFGRLRSETSEELILTGKDPFYIKGAQLGRLFVPYTAAGWPIEVRVARHVTGIKNLVGALNTSKPDRSILIQVPSYKDIVANGVGAYLNAPTD
jgi:hypothetical protein